MSTLSTGFLASLRAELARYLEIPDAGRVDVRDAARQVEVLPLFWGWEAFGGLDMAGEPVWVNYEPPYVCEPIDGVLNRNFIFHRATKRSADLVEIAPIRSAGSLTCSQCHGTGVAMVSNTPHPEVVCYCGGLGWLPPGVPSPPLAQPPETLPPLPNPFKRFWRRLGF